MASPTPAPPSAVHISILAYPLISTQQLPTQPDTTATCQMPVQHAHPPAAMPALLPQQRCQRIQTLGMFTPCILPRHSSDCNCNSCCCTLPQIFLCLLKSPRWQSLQQYRTLLHPPQHHSRVSCPAAPLYALHALSAAGPPMNALPRTHPTWQQSRQPPSRLTHFPRTCGAQVLAPALRAAARGAL
jgi:hypothetical protein